MTAGGTDADVLVVGGGVLGCAAAYYLTRHGAQVVLVERAEINSQASAQNAGSLHFHLERRMLEHGDEVMRDFSAIIPIHVRAERLWRTLEDELEEDLEVDQSGGFVVAETADQEGVLQHKVGVEQRAGLATELLSGSEARELAPNLALGIRAASYYAGEGHANPRLVGPAYLRAADRTGRLSTRTSTAVTGLRRRNRDWHAELSDGRGLRADAVVVAAGAWTMRVLAMADVNLPVSPVGLGMVVTARTRPLLHHLIQHVGERLTLKHVSDGNILIGGGWPALLHRVATGEFDLDRRPTVLLDSIVGSVDIARRTVPAISSLPVIRSWSGIVGVAADGLPVIGEVPRRPGLFVTLGTFTLAPAYGQLIADEILTREPSPDLQRYRPRRFGHLNLL